MGENMSERGRGGLRKRVSERLLREEIELKDECPKLRPGNIRWSPWEKGLKWGGKDFRGEKNSTG